MAVMSVAAIYSAFGQRGLLASMRFADRRPCTFAEHDLR